MSKRFEIDNTGGKKMKGTLTLLNDEGDEDDAYTDSQISSSLSSSSDSQSDDNNDNSDNDSDNSQKKKSGNNKFVSQFGGSAVSHWTSEHSSSDSNNSPKNRGQKKKTVWVMPPSTTKSQTSDDVESPRTKGGFFGKNGDSDLHSKLIHQNTN